LASKQVAMLLIIIAINARRLVSGYQDSALLDA